MAAGAWTVVDSFKKYIGDGTIDFDTDTLKVALFTSASNIATTSATLAGLTNEVGVTNTGYATGGVTVATPAVTQATGTTKYTATSIPAWTAGTAGLTARYAVLYKSGTANSVANPLIAFMLLESPAADVSVTSTNTLTISVPANGFFTLA